MVKLVEGGTAVKTLNCETESTFDTIIEDLKKAYNL